MAEAAGPTLTLDLVHDVGELTAYPFMVHALEAGACAAILAGALGWFMVLRGQSFAGHALSSMAFPGGSGAALLGVTPAYGYLACCALAAAAMAGGGGRRWRRRDLEGGGRGAGTGDPVTVAIVQAVGLAAGFAFLSLNGRVLGDLESVLFGTLLGISATQVALLAAVCAAGLLILAFIGRPLWFASVDPAVAAARGLPVRGLGATYLVLLGLAVGAVSQITGVLLVFALLVAPAAAVRELTARPGLGLALSVGIGLGVCWVGLAISYFSPYPVGFWISSVGFGTFACARLGHALVRWGAGRRGAGRALPGGR